jgi:saccharopine dehydrogenase-like NADP-dependent oxidoreductase
MIATQAAIKAGVNYLDLGGLFNTPRQLELDAAAREADVTVCLGCGATPGVTNLMARHAADQLDEVHEVHIAFASYRAIAPSPGLLDTVLDEFSPGSRRFFWRDGEFVEVPAFSGAKRVRFADPVGEIETYYVPHSETHTIHRFIGKGVRVVDVRGTWAKEIMQALRLFAALELTGAKETQFNGELIPAKQFLRAHVLEHAAGFGGDGDCAFLLNVQVEGQRNGRRELLEYTTRHPSSSEWSSTGTAKMTGIPASIAAQKLGKGEVLRKGVMSPEACFDAQSFFDELAARQIVVEAHQG